MVIWNCIRRLLSYCYKRDLLFVYCCDVAETLKKAPPMLSELVPHVCDRENLERMKTIITPFPKLIGERVQRGDLAFMAVQDSRWIFRSSVILGPNEHIVTGHAIHLGETDAYLECAETIPTWRGKGIAPGMLQITMRTLLERGYSRAFLTIAITNTSSSRAIEKGGVQRIGLISACRVLGRWWSSYIPLTNDEQFAKVAG